MIFVLLSFQNSFEKFDRYLEKKFSMNNSFLPLPLLQGGAQAGGISMPNLPSLSNNQKPFHPRMKSLQEINEKSKQNGNPKKPIFAKLEEDDDIDESDKNGETNFCSEKDPLTKPVIRNRVNSKFNYHRDSLMENREKRKSDENPAENEEKPHNPNLDKISKLDIFARTVFPLFYVIFTLAYFIYYFGTK